MNSREREVVVKQEGDPKLPRITPSGRSQWSSHKNPRIVRVSRSFGGKDRHSKVCTVRGLRDRRIRLSVPTAIQLYDLQDRLGLSQPSKVVDWLLDATKNDIDKLPPLPIIPGTFTHFHDQSPPPLPNPHIQHFLPYAKDTLGMKISSDQDHDQQQNHEGFGGFVAQLSAQNLFPLANLNQASFPAMPYNPYFHWDHPNLSLSHIGGAYPNLPHHEDQSHNSSNLSSTVLPSTSQLFLPAIIPSFPSYITPSMENVQQNPLFSTALHLTSPMKSVALNVNSKSLHSHQNYDAGRSGKEE